MNTIRANYKICCEYPTLVIWAWQYKACQDECKKLSLGLRRCCIDICNQRTSKILNIFYDDKGTVANTSVSHEGLYTGFMLSVGNDTRWTPIIKSSVDYCYEKYVNVKMGVMCMIPQHLYRIIDCIYHEDFLNCPVWNAHRLKECEYTFQYIQKCGKS